MPLVNYAGCTVTGRSALLNPQRLVTEPILIKHVVCLVKDEDLDPRRINHPPADEVRHRAGCAYNDVCGYVRRAFRQVVFDRVLGLYRGKLAHGDDNGHDLPCELTGGRQTDCLCGVLSGMRDEEREVRACGLLTVKSTRLSIVRTKAAVFPVPDCDCPIMFVGLGINVL